MLELNSVRFEESVQFSCVIIGSANSIYSQIGVLEEIRYQ